MMNLIWAAIFIVSFIYACLAGNLGALNEALTEAASEAVEFIIGLAGIMAMWSGLMEIAERTGYSNPTYFCRVFKKHTGSTIGDLREQARKKRF